MWKSHQKSHFHNSVLHPHEINPITYNSKFIYVTLSTPKKYVLETFAYVCGNITSKFDVQIEIYGKQTGHLGTL